MLNYAENNVMGLKIDKGENLRINWGKIMPEEGLEPTKNKMFRWIFNPGKSGL